MEDILNKYLRTFNVQLRELKNIFKKNKENIKLEIKKVQDRCGHWEKTYHGDPAGGHDSFYKCNICGKEL